MSKKTKTKNKKKKSRGLIIFLSVLLILVALVGFAITNYETVLAAFGISSDFANQTKDNDKYTMLSVKENLYENLDPNVLLGETNYINVLLFGLDEDESRHDTYTIFRPDTIMLISVNFDTEKISILSIPRDTYVPIYGRGGKDKINSCFYYGSLMSYDSSEEMFQNGVDTLKGTVSNILGGIPIHYYVGVNMDTAAEIIDAIGGVPFNLEYDVYLDGNNLFYTAGEKVWDGENFITLARLRGYADGDIERTQMQQKLLKALFDAVKNIKLTKLPGVIKLAYQSINTDINMKTAVSFVLAATEIDTSNIQTATMPGFFGAYYNQSYWVINQTQRVALIRDLYGISASYMEQDPDLIIEYLYETIDGKEYRYYINQNSKARYVDDNGNEWTYDQLENYVHKEDITPTPDDTPSGGTGEESGGTTGGEGSEGGTTPPDEGGSEGGGETPTTPTTPEAGGGESEDTPEE